MGQHPPYAFEAPGLTVDLLALTEELFGSPAIAREGRTSRTLAKASGFTTVLIAMRAGRDLRDHPAPGHLVVHAISGSPVFEGDFGRVPVPAGTVLHLPSGTRHRVTAAEDSAFLLTIGPRP